MKERITSPLKAAYGGMFLGSEGWIDEMRQRLADETDDRNVPARRQLAKRICPQKLREHVAEYFGVSPEAFTDVRRRNNDARTVAIYLQRKLTSDSVTSLAQQYGGVSVAAISKTVARAERRRTDDRKWDQLLIGLEKLTP